MGNDEKTLAEVFNLGSFTNSDKAYYTEISSENSDRQEILFEDILDIEGKLRERSILPNQPTEINQLEAEIAQLTVRLPYKIAIQIHKNMLALIRVTKTYDIDKIRISQIKLADTLTSSRENL